MKNSKYHNETNWIWHVLLILTPYMSLMGGLLYCVSNPYAVNKIAILLVAVIQAALYMLGAKSIDLKQTRSGRQLIGGGIVLLYLITIPVMMAMYTCLSCAFEGNTYTFIDMILNSELAKRYALTLTYQPSSLGIMGLMLTFMPALALAYKGLIAKVDDITASDNNSTSDISS